MTHPRVSVDCTGPATVALLRHRDGRIELLRFDGAAELPSGVYRANDGRLLTGRVALDAAASDPDRYIASPLHLLANAPPSGSTAEDPVAVVAALLSRVQVQATGTAGAPVNHAVLVVPPSWGPQRRTRVRHAAHRAGLTDIDIVDAATALSHRSASQTVPGDQHLVLILQLAGPETDATILRRQDPGWEIVATITKTVDCGLDAAAATGHVAALTTQALEAADLTGAAITSTVLHAPAAHVPAIGDGLRRLGITTTIRTAADTDAAYSALDLCAAGEQQVGPRRLGRARHAVAAAIPLCGAAALVWLLLQTGIHPSSPRAQQITVTPPEHLLTHWPAWSMVAVLVCAGALAIVLHQADQRLIESTKDTEVERRTLLVRGLRITAAATVAAGVVTAMLGAATYPIVPIAALLVWAIGPALFFAATSALMASLVHHGHTSALRWQLWLRIPNSTIALAVAGLVLIHIDLSITVRRFTPLADLPISEDFKTLTGLGRLGAIAVALAILPLFIRRTDRRILLSPLIIAVILWTHSYSNTAFVIGALLVSIGLWWIARIRPAAAYSDPHHPASILAAELEPAISTNRDTG